MQAELQLAKERLRRKSVVLARQEEEMAARGKAIDTAAVDAQALQHAFNRAQQDADARKVRPGHAMSTHAHIAGTEHKPCAVLYGLC